MPVPYYIDEVAKRAGVRPWQTARLQVLPASWLVTASMVACFAASATAQQYKVDEIDDKAGRNGNIAQLCAKGTTPYTAAERAKVEEYFTKFFFADMTRHDPTALGQLGDKRDKRLFRTFLCGTANPQFQSDVTKWAFDGAKKMASPGYHPAVRYNAILIMGLLDQEYAIEAGANRRPPKPLPQANDFLVKIVTAGAAGNKVVSPVVLAGALVGLERHAKFRGGLPREAPAAMTAAVLKILTADKPAMDMDREVTAWMRFKAACVLAELTSVGNNGEVHNAIVKMIGDGRTLDDRCAFAALVFKLNYDGAKIDGAVAADKLLTLARDVAEAEAKRAEEFRDMSFAGGGGMSMDRGMYRGRGEEGGGGYSEEEKDDYPRRHVLARLTNLTTGITKLKPLVPAEAQKKFDVIVAAIEPAIEAAADKDTVSLNVASDIVNMSRAITAVTGATAPAAATADDGGFDTPPPDVTPPAATPPNAAPAETAPAAAEPAAAPDAGAAK